MNYKWKLFSIRNKDEHTACMFRLVNQMREYDSVLCQFQYTCT